MSGEWEGLDAPWSREEAAELIGKAIAGSGAPERIRRRMARWLGWMAAASELTDYMEEEGCFPLVVDFEDEEDHGKGWRVSRLKDGKWERDPCCFLSEAAAEAIWEASDGK